MAEPQHVDTEAIRDALEATKPHDPPKPPRLSGTLWSAALIGVCFTVLALVSNFALYAWGKSKTHELERLQSTVEVTADVLKCRSQLAADVDVTKGEFLFAFGRLVDVGLDPSEDIAVRRAAFADARAKYTVTVTAYGKALDRRARTDEICTT